VWIEVAAVENFNEAEFAGLVAAVQDFAEVLTAPRLLEMARQAVYPCYPLDFVKRLNQQQHYSMGCIRRQN